MPTPPGRSPGRVQGGRDVFAGYPAPYVFDKPRNGKKVQQLLWGDWVTVGDERRGGWIQVLKARNEAGWIRETDLQRDRLLEVNFVDVGQGDGCFIVTPDDDRILIDAGKGDNMFWFLRWRFNLRADPDRKIHFDHAVISHSDEDHYAGFQPLLDSEQFTFGTIHHNGLVERTGRNLLGGRSADGKHQIELIKTKTALKRLLTDDAVGGKKYPKLLRTALRSDRVDDIRMLSSKDGHLPGYDTGDLTIEVVAPVTGRTDNKPSLPRFDGNDGKTKNGHSVVLRLRHHDVTMVLGGDLNAPSQRYLLQAHTGLDPQPADGPARDDLIAAARPIFGCDITKSCHHGSGDFAEEFLEATNALATVISSGDNEPYAHPRPDAIGAAGRYGRGPRPLIFSTELARSPAETSKRPEAVRARNSDTIDTAREDIATDGTSSEEAPGRGAYAYQRAIAVYGMINLRTDGHRVVMAQKLERNAPSGAEWDYHCMEIDGGELVSVPDR
jgi:beta-lactamase superfamily II metal-dependent hydrolase